MIDELMIDDTGHDQLTLISIISQKCQKVSARTAASIVQYT